jgi:hypothetical protein
MAIANITGNILTDSGVATSSLLPLTGGTLTGALNGTSAVFSSTIDGTIINSTSNAFRLNGNNALSLVTLNSQSVVKINAAGFWGVQLVGANDKGILINNTGEVQITSRNLSVTNNVSNEIGVWVKGVGTHTTGYASIQSFASDVTYDTKLVLQQNGGNVLIGTLTNVGQKLRIYQPTTSEWNIKLIQPDGSSQLFQEFLTTTDGDASNTARGSIRYNGTNVLYLGTSDYRLKEDLKDYNGLNIISQIKTYNFNWKEANTRDYGVMAHELQEVLPNYVTGAKDDINEDGSINPQQVDYSKLVPVLVKAIQELNAKVSALENKS